MIFDFDWGNGEQDKTHIVRWQVQLCSNMHISSTAPAHYSIWGTGVRINEQEIPAWHQHLFLFTSSQFFSSCCLYLKFLSILIYNPLWCYRSRICWPTSHIMSTCPQKEVKDQPASLSSQHFGFPSRCLPSRPGLQVKISSHPSSWPYRREEDTSK